MDTAARDPRPARGRIENWLMGAFPLQTKREREPMLADLMAIIEDAYGTTQLQSLAGSNPANDPVPGREHSETRLRAAYVQQQPSPVPDQLAIVWRLDIGRLLAELTHKRAFFDMHTKKDAADVKENSND